MATPFTVKSTGEDHTELAFPPTAPLARYVAGSVLSGKYRLEVLLGEGGMGAVWRASNLLLDSPVAIKLIRADLDHQALRARLQLEARSVAKLGHPAIVRIYDVGETEQGDPFIVMELLQGETLAQMLSQGRLSAVRAVQLLLPIIDACAVAHARGIVHRDLKPDNLLIAFEDQRTQPKILDFGIAKLSDPRDLEQRLTEVGTVVGSPDYMSPEQARGHDDVDYRTDIWSLSVVLYEAMTGRVPFSASNYNALLRAIVEDEPSALFDHASGDLRLWEIVKKGLAKQREDRHRSMAELGRVLAAWLVSHGVHEDVCGTSVQSKWLGQASDSLGLGEVTPEGPTLISSVFNPKLTHDSRTGSNEADLRGPFTATIRPDSGTRRRTLRVAAATCAVLGAMTAASALAPTQRPALSAMHLASSAVPPAPPRQHAQGAPGHASGAALGEPVRVTSVSPAPPAPTSRQPAHPATSSARSAAIITMSVPRVSTSSPRVTSVPSAKSSTRELDLISPY